MNKMLRVCMLVPKFSRNKTEEDNIRAIASKLTDFIDVLVIAPHDIETKDFEIIDDIKVYRFNYFLPKGLHKLAYKDGIILNIKKNLLAKIQIPFFIISSFLKLNKLSKKYDLVNAQWLIMGAIALLSRKFTKKPVIVTLRHSGLLHYPEFFKSYVLKNSDAVIALTSELFEKASKYSKKVFYIPGLVDETKFENKDIKNIRKEFKIKKEKIVTYLARLDPYYEPLVFVDAINIFLKKNKFSIKFFIVGDGPLLKEVKEKVNRLGLNDKVIITGWRNDSHKFLMLSDVFVTLTSNENLWSRTIIEATFANAACILTKAGSTETLFKHKENCFLIDINNSTQLAEGITFLLKNKKLSNQIAKNAKKLIYEQGFSNNDILNKTFNLYKSILNIKN